MEKKKVQLTKANILELFDFFSDISGQKNKQYVEFCLRNKNILKIEKEIIDAVIEYSEKENEYLKKEWELLSKFGLTENGQIKIPPVIPKDNIDEFNTEIKKLKESDKENFNAVLEKNKQKEELLSEKIEVELHTIEYKYIPDSIESEIYIFLREREIIVD